MEKQTARCTSFEGPTYCWFVGIRGNISSLSCSLISVKGVICVITIEVGYYGFRLWLTWPLYDMFKRGPTSTDFHLLGFSCLFYRVQ